MMAEIMLDGELMDYQPTLDGYEKEAVPLGSFARSLSGTLHARVNAVKWKWTLTGYLGGQRAMIIVLPARGSFTFVDVDGASHTVMCTSSIPLDLTEKYQLTLEEV